MNEAYHFGFSKLNGQSSWLTGLPEMLISLHQGVRFNLEANAVGILLISVCLASIVFLFWQVSVLWRCWTSLLVVRGSRCFYISGYSADDLLGVSEPRILDRKGKIFLADGNKVRRLKVSELAAWLNEDELRIAKRNISRPFKICVVRNHAIPRSVSLPD